MHKSHSKVALKHLVSSPSLHLPARLCCFAPSFSQFPPRLEVCSASKFVPQPEEKRLKKLLHLFLLIKLLIINADPMAKSNGKAFFMLTVRGRRMEKHDLLQQDRAELVSSICCGCSRFSGGALGCERVCVCVVLRQQLLYGAVSCSTCSPSHNCCKTDLRVFSGPALLVKDRECLSQV